MINKQYRTSDIVLSATLKVLGYDIVSIEVNNYKGTFTFEDVDDQIISDFDIGKILVEPLMFNNTIKQLTTSVKRH